MRQRELTGCLNPYKHHLWRLPSIPRNLWVPAHKADSTEALVVFPLFLTREGDQSLEHHLVRSACWARRSWLLFSDAIERRVQVAFYVGDTVLDRVAPILEENGIDVNRDVFLFDEGAFRGEPCTHLGKKLAVFGDRQFSDVRWMFQMDSDMFLASKGRETFPFFEWFAARREEGVGAVRAHLVGGETTEHRNLEDHHWHHCLLDTGDMQAKAAEWLRRAAQFSSESVVRKYTDRLEFIITCHGGIYGFPARRMHREQGDKLDWIVTCGKVMQDDEAVFSLWAMNGEDLFCISRETGLPFCTEISRINEYRERGNGVYYSHLGTLVHEWNWRADIDAL